MVEDLKKDKRIALFSDTHGNAQAIREAVIYSGPFDMLFHLGDGVRDGKQVAQEFKLPFYGVMGNEDHGLDLPDQQVVLVGAWSFYLLHGHQSDLNRYQPKKVFEKQLIKLCRRAKSQRAPIILFGHTHQVMIKELNDCLLCNPGNQYFGSAQPPTFAILNIQKDILDISIMINRNKDWRILEDHTITRQEGNHERTD